METTKRFKISYRHNSKLLLRLLHLIELHKLFYADLWCSQKIY